MQRREFVNLTAYSAIVLAFPLMNGCRSKQIEIESQPLFFSLLADVKTIRAAGEAYRKASPDEDSKNKLAELLLANNKPGEGDYSAIRALLNNKVKHDFAAGRVAVIGGWVLSVTEARQCALFSILQP